MESTTTWTTTSFGMAVRSAAVAPVAGFGLDTTGVLCPQTASRRDRTDVRVMNAQVPATGVARDAIASGSRPWSPPVT